MEVIGAREDLPERDDEAREVVDRKRSELQIISSFAALDGEVDANRTGALKLRGRQKEQEEMILTGDFRVDSERVMKTQIKVLDSHRGDLTGGARCVFNQLS